MPPQNPSNESEEIDVSEIIERLDHLEEKISSQTKEFEKIKTIGSRLDSIESRLKDIDECIDAIADALGNG